MQRRKRGTNGYGSCHGTALYCAVTIGPLLFPIGVHIHSVQHIRQCFCVEVLHSPLSLFRDGSMWLDNSNGVHYTLESAIFATALQLICINVLATLYMARYFLIGFLAPKLAGFTEDSSTSGIYKMSAPFSQEFASFRGMQQLSNQGKLGVPRCHFGSIRPHANI